MQNESHNVKQPPSTCVVSLSLLDPSLLLISNIPVQLSNSVQQSHELISSMKHHGYATKLKMLNSLKRYFEEMNYKIEELPNIAFKMWKGLGLFSPGGQKKGNYGISHKVKKTLKTNSFYGNKGKGNIQLIHLGRWILASHQRKTVQYFLQCGKKMILGDDWNLGKTVTCLACCQYSKSRKVLIIAPKSRIAHWIWHINQLQISLSPSKNVGVVRKQSKGQKILRQKIQIQILDLESPQNIRQNSDCKMLKKQSIKSEVKFKSEDVVMNNQSIYTICSYEYMNSIQNFSSVSFNMLVLDHPSSYSNSQQSEDNNNVKIYGQSLNQCNSYGQPQKIEDQGRKTLKQSLKIALNIDCSLIKQLSKIENIIVNSSAITVEQTRFWIPLLNNKIDSSEVEMRYGNINEKLKNRDQYVNSMHRYYFRQCFAFTTKSPFSLIKKIILPISVVEKQQVKQLKTVTQHQCIQYQQQDNKKQESLLDYLNWRMQVQNNNDLFLITSNEFLKTKIMSNIHSNQTKKATKQQPKVGNIEQILAFLQQNDVEKKRQRPTTLLLNPLPSSQSSLSLLYKLQKYTNIQCITYCRILMEKQIHQSFQQYRYRATIIEDCFGEWQFNQVNVKGCIQRAALQAEELSSCGVEGVYKNPQRYYESASSEDVRMIDENQELQKQNQEQMKPELNQICIISDSEVQIASKQYRKTQKQQKNDEMLINQADQPEQKSLSNVVILNRTQFLQQDQKRSLNQANILQLDHNSNQKFASLHQNADILDHHKFLQENLNSVELSGSKNQVKNADAKQKNICKSRRKGESKLSENNLFDRSIMTRMATRSSKGINNIEIIDSSLSLSKPKSKSNRSKSKKSKQNEKPQRVSPIIPQLPIKQPTPNWTPIPSSSPPLTYIQINSDQPQIPTLAPPPPLPPKHNKIKSKQVLSIKLVPRISQKLYENYSNNSDTFC